MYGLGAGVWTRDGARAFRMGRAIKAGRVWTNCYHLYPAHAAFGGYKASGVGRENHKMMLDHYSQTKCLLVSYDPKRAGVLLGRAMTTRDRVTATPQALETIRALAAPHGPLVFHQSGGCCDGSSPMCLLEAELPAGPARRAARRGRRARRSTSTPTRTRAGGTPTFLLDVAPGAGDEPLPGGLAATCTSSRARRGRVTDLHPEGSTP